MGTITDPTQDLTPTGSPTFAGLTVSGTIDTTGKVTITDAANEVALQIDSGNTGASEALRINTLGTSFVAVFRNQNASSQNAGILVDYSASSPNGTADEFYRADDSTTTRFAVRSNGGIANFQSNDADLSDERIKTELSPLGSYWNKFKGIEIGTFRYLDQEEDTPDNIGVMAQQVAAVAAEFVEVPEDEEELLRVYNKDLYFGGFKCLQEAMDRIEELEDLVK